MRRIGTWKLKIRMFLATIFLFAIIYAILMLIGHVMGFGGPLFYMLLGLGIILLQYLISPSIVEATMRVKYVSPEEAPRLHAMVEELAIKAGIPKPRVGIADIGIPNAFAFGRTKSDGRVCVTSGILRLLDEEELKAVLGHEISHIRHNDMIVMTFISAIPLICYYIYISSIFSRDRDMGLIGLLALAAYLIGQLVVLFISRVREYYADYGSVEIGGQPHKLASALYKLVYGSAASKEDEIREVEGLKAFFVNDVSRATSEIEDLRQVDLDMNGTISEGELQQIKYRDVKIGAAARIMELLSTHPNMLKRIKRLSELT
ncbi:MAG TPA: M48 family metalloprotease [Methanothermobacter sp.]|jgi:heat shock protein HtpX|uniref:Protease HtpX homolog n=1 Tax=Methanothermobacter tenebrarum TaxID=680118 RepID=A0ABN6PFA1_9EURY|nr:zinc metalloprotease HtpX [Methanothermobacter tenebrarum]MDD3454289.1 zinc metalloprotease HtpX [Methanobacteriales archaeon]MDI6881348.1 zinc metalloprotease HtpX [Methanothermobacter sp.]MDX9693931.1 zinc metalloprotease HtpX [Methanothermobacter sp.]BDH79622.1 protease HtpX [Methanothermobacter tenebrarum]HHW15884.1 M48 family metalloprotease [Methanothermobacter sp.]